MYPKHTVFVYGTLKRGLANHALLRGAPLLGRARTRELLALHPGPGYPFASRRERRYRVHGELYGVDDAVLAELDRLEGHPHDYRREVVEIEQQGGELVRAWMYLHPGPFRAVLSCGKWTG